MSKIKQFYENVADAVTDAMYQECMGMDDVIYSDKSDVWEETFRQLMDNPYDVYSYLYDSLSDSDSSEMPLTAKAVSILEPIVTEYVGRRTA